MESATLHQRVAEAFPNLVTQSFSNYGDSYVVIQKTGILSFFKSLKTGPDFGFDMLMDLTAVDYLFWEEKSERYELIYQLYASKFHHRLFVKVPVNEKDSEIDSVTAIWPAADWYEREVFDMFGLVFKGHPNLKRILMYEGFVGHPLRKDYPYNKRQPLIGPFN